MKKLIDRKNEWNTLVHEYNRKDAAFVVVYGRRRVGKTTLVSHFLEGKRSISFLATQENETQNRNMFQQTVAETLQNELLKSVILERWEPIFDVIADAASKEERLVLFIDEFQYLGKANSSFPSILMRIWDEKLKNKNIMLIVCGSLIRMMTDQLLNYNSPLYGRRTAQIRMKQIPFEYYVEFMPERSKDELVQRYAVTGGVPKYIELFEDHENIYDAIETNILNPNAFLYAEPEFLLQNEVSEVGHYFSILKVIAAGNQKLDSMASALEEKKTSLSSYLKTLAELDIIEREVPITEENPEKSKKGRYRIKDNFIKFWFQFVFPYRGMLEAGRTDYVLEKIQAHFIDNHVSYVYEDVCKEQIWQMNGERFNVNRVGRYWDKHEIDALAYDSNGNDIVFGECKYSVNPKGMNILADLKEKATEVDWKRSNRNEFYVIFSRSGFTTELQKYAEEHHNIILVSLEDR